MQAVRLGAVVGLAVLFLATLFWVSAATANTIISSSRPETVNTESQSNGTVITVGVGAALSVIPALGWRQVNAVQLAVEKVNAAGGINIAGTMHTLTLVTADDGCNATQGATAANGLLNAGAVAVIGYTCSGASNGAQPLHAAASVPMISLSSTDPLVTEQGNTTTLRVISRDDRPPTLLATYLRNWLYLEGAAIVELDGFWGNWATDGISTTFISLGGTITSRRTVSSIEQFTTTSTAIQAEDADVIFYSDGDSANAALLSRVAHNLGMTDTIIAWNTFSEDETVLVDYAAGAGIAAEGYHAVMFYRRTQDMPGYEVFNDAYKAAGFSNYGDEARTVGAYAYDAANIIIISAIERAQSTNPKDICDAIASTTNYQGVVGIYEAFDARGDVIPQRAWLVRYSNGQWMILHPGKVFLPLTLLRARNEPNLLAANRLRCPCISWIGGESSARKSARHPQLKSASRRLRMLC